MADENYIQAEKDIRAEIAARRAEDVKLQGAAQGLDSEPDPKLPPTRQQLVTPFLKDSGVICEIKRRSPSVANINRELDPVEQARHYIDSGVQNISVLTEQNYFGGSLEDLIKIKTAYPEISVLRKDFLLTDEDVEISYRAGADSFLLIASLLSNLQLTAMYHLGISLGMTPLVELHSRDDVEKASRLKPRLVGINSRNLKTFRINPLQPLRIRSMIDWECRIVYESGIKTEYDIDFAAGTGFDAVLVGEAAVKNKSFAGELAKRFSGGVKSGKKRLSEADRRFSFWQKLYSRRSDDRPLVKICGITNREDLNLVKSAGADAAGFILAESPRRVGAEFIRSCGDIDILKIGVVVLGKNEPLPDYIRDLLKEGVLDAVQFHGDEQPSEYLEWPGYKAVRIKDSASAEAAGSLPGPAVLVDAFSKEAHGGTGKRIQPELVQQIAGQQILWLAGGIKPDNVGSIITDFKPDLIDISSGVEAEPGIKDPQKIKALFMAIDNSTEPEVSDEKI